MQVGPRLEFKQSQQLVMTPQLQQAIKLLQMSSIDVSAFIAAEVERNPILTLDDGGGERAAKAEAKPSEGVDAQVRNDDPGSAGDGFDTGAENLSGGDDRLSGAGEPSSSWTGTGSKIGQGGDLPRLEDQLSNEVSLREHLLQQIAIADCAPQPRLLASLLVDELDEIGYLRADLGALTRRLGTRCGMIDQAIALLQSCDPVGVGARDLKECLALQLRERNRLDPAMQALLDNLDDLAAARVQELQVKCGIGKEDLIDMIAEIRALNPRPGAAFSVTPVQTVVPDVHVSRAPLGGWSVELNPEALPKVLLDTHYAAELNRLGETESKSFVAECRQNADWLLRALDQRAQTIVKVASEIVKRQNQFFIEGVSGLRPMTLAMVASEIEMHESTVSRVTTNKYLWCERGTFEMKFFFTQAIASANGTDALSAEAVRGQIKALIEKENERKPLSDDAIVTLLKQNGVDIARRTVAKYREAMNIPSSARRKRMKAAALT
ncbi:MAG: RNA polymerase factor sigma-54 [Pseudomonadota bacterium]